MNYLEDIDYSLNHPNWPYASNGIYKVITAIIRTEGVSKDEKAILLDYDERIAAANYYNMWTHTIDNKKLEVFQSLCGDLKVYIKEVLGL